MLDTGDSYKNSPGCGFQDPKSTVIWCRYNVISLTEEESLSAEGSMINAG